MFERLVQSKVRQAEPVEMWTLLGDYQMRTQRQHAAHATMQKALRHLEQSSAPKADRSSFTPLRVFT